MEPQYTSLGAETKNNDNATSRRLENWMGKQHQGSEKIKK